MAINFAAAVWQIDQDYTAPQVQLPPVDIAGHPFSRIWQKCLDGTTWMRAFDGHPMSIGSVADAIAAKNAQQAEGKLWVGWSNVRGTLPELEGQLAGEIAVATKLSEFVPSYIANIEPYAQFWEWKGPESRRRATQFLEGYARAGGRWLGLWIDARGWQLSEEQGIGLVHWLEEIERLNLGYAVIPECYWNAFNETPADCLGRTALLLGALGVMRGDIWPTFPSPVPVEQYMEGLHAVKTLSLGETVSFWRRGDMAIRSAEWLTQYLGNSEPTQPEPPHVSDYDRGYTDGKLRAMNDIQQLIREYGSA